MENHLTCHSKLRKRMFSILLESILAEVRRGGKRRKLDLIDIIFIGVKYHR